MRQQTAQTDPLLSWNEWSSKRSILHLVEVVTPAGGEEFVPTNSMLSIFSEEEVHDVVVVLGEPSLDRYEITYTLDFLDGEMPEKGGACALIDVVDRPLIPVSVAGAYRRRRCKGRRRVRRRTGAAAPVY